MKFPAGFIYYKRKLLYIPVFAKTIAKRCTLWRTLTQCHFSHGFAITRDLLKGGKEP